MSQAENLKVDFLFKNIGSHVIPPFACMERVYDIGKKEDRQDASEFDFYIQRMYPSNKYVGTDPLVMCDRPSVAGEYLQDFSSMAINGPSEVGPGKYGRCSIGQFPVRALVNGWGGGSGLSRLAIVRNEFALVPIGINKSGSAYATSFNTGQRVAVASSLFEDKVTRTIQADVMQVIGVNRPGGPVSGYGRFGVKGVGQNYIRLLAPEPYSTSSTRFLPIFGDKLLEIQTPGRYRFAIDVKVTHLDITPSDVYSLPFRFGILPASPDHYSYFRTANSGFRNGRTEFPTFTLNKYFYHDNPSTHPENFPYLINPDDPPVGKREIWSYGWLRYTDTFTVTKAPMTLIVKQELSPYINIGNVTADDASEISSDGQITLLEITPEIDRMSAYDFVFRTTYFNSLAQYNWFFGPYSAYYSQRGQASYSSGQQLLTTFVPDDRFTQWNGVGIFFV